MDCAAIGKPIRLAGNKARARALFNASGCGSKIKKTVLKLIPK